MLETFFSPATTPFAVAICLMLFIAAVEVVGALMGIPASAMLDSLIPEIDVDLDVEVDYAGGALDGDVPNIPNAPSAGPLSQILGWLCVGKVPILVLLIVFLTAFGLSGIFIQSIAQGLIGVPFPAFIAAIPALAAAIPVTRVSGLALSKLMPKEQTEAVSQKHFIGKVAIIVRGKARKGSPAEAKLTDSFGQTHYVLIEPDDETESFMQGTEVIIVKQLGSIYRAILNTSAALSNDVASKNINRNGGDNV
jgi:Inner membrane protein YqiJ, N-terminal/Inner membrane protein YqiJ, OB-fold